MQKIGFPNLYVFVLMTTHWLLEPVLRIREVYPGSRPNFFHPGSRIRIKKFRYIGPKIVSKLAEIWSGFGLFIPDPDPNFLPIPDPEVKKAPDPGSGSATLALTDVLVEKSGCEGACWAGQVRVPGGTVHAHQQQAPVQRRH
jgi:hypothetical protein